MDESRMHWLCRLFGHDREAWLVQMNEWTCSRCRMEFWNETPWHLRWMDRVWFWRIRAWIDHKTWPLRHWNQRCVDCGELTRRGGHEGCLPF